MNTALLKRLRRAACLVRSGVVIVGRPVGYWELGERTFSADFGCRSQSDPRKKYDGELYFDQNGHVIHAECKCQDHWVRAKGSEWTAAYKNGAHRCKHDLAAEMLERVGVLRRKAEYPVGHVFGS